MKYLMKLNKTTRMTVVLIVLLAVAGCSENSRQGQVVINNPKEICVQGVVYYSFGHGKAPAHKTNGDLRLCSN